MNDERHQDDCPRCGQRVEASGARGVGSRGEGEELPEATEQGAMCPKCGAELRRGVGMPWQLAEGSS